MRKAFDLADSGTVDIGITSNAMALKKGRQIPDYEKRVKQLEDFLKSIHVNEESYKIQKLENPYGTTLTGDYDYLVVSPETYPVAIKINEIREQNGLDAIAIIKIEYVLADDDAPISSTRIEKGEIDIHGHLKGTRL